jgi:hypothetical protein
VHAATAGTFAGKGANHKAAMKQWDD